MPNIQLIDYHGSDELIAKIARLSHGEKGSSTDEQLIRFLIKHEHMSVFEFAGATFRIKAPLFVARQWFRHRIASYLEKSLRYTKADERMYHSFDENRLPHELRTIYENSIKQSFNTYNELMNKGVPKEVARSVLPMSTMTEFYVYMNLRSWFNFLKLRMDKHAQYEIRMYANDIYEMLESLFPISMKEWKLKNGF